MMPITLDLMFHLSEHWIQLDAFNLYTYQNYNKLKNISFYC